jgi:hypothetical protein
MATSSVSVVTNSLRLRRFRESRSANAVRHPILVARVSEGAYLVAIAALAVGLGWALLQWTNQASANAEPAAAAAQGVRVDLALIPPRMVAGETVTLQYRLVDDQTAAPVTDLAIDHDRIMHVVLVSLDFADFQHVNPVEVAPGVYETPFTPTVDGHHMAYATFKRGRDNLYNLAGHKGAVPDAGLTPDLAPKDVNGVRVALIPPTTIYANRPSLFRVHATQTSDGDAVRNLEAFLGAAANVTMVSGDRHHFMHMYAQPGVPRKTGMRDKPTPTLPFGPDLGFTQTFDEPGLYRVWVKIQRAGQVITAPFTIEVI